MVKAVSLGEQLKRARKESGYSQDEIAQKLEVKRELISYYETDTREIPVSLLMKMADMYGKTMAYFFEKKEEASLRVAYRAENVTSDDEEQILWAKEFVKNLYELKDLTKR